MSDVSELGTFEECADELNDFVGTLQRYPHTVLVFALRAHLCGLLQALRSRGQWSGAEAAVFVEELARELQAAIELGSS